MVVWWSMLRPAIALCVLAACGAPQAPPVAPASARPGRVLIIVWDGLRPDAIGPDTPTW